MLFIGVSGFTRGRKSGKPHKSAFMSVEAVSVFPFHIYVVPYYMIILHLFIFLLKKFIWESGEQKRLQTPKGKVAVGPVGHDATGRVRLDYRHFPFSLQRLYINVIIQ